MKTRSLTIQIVNMHASGWLIRRRPEGATDPVWHLEGTDERSLCRRFTPAKKHDQWEMKQYPGMVFCSFCLKAAQERQG